MTQDNSHNDFAVMLYLLYVNIVLIVNVVVGDCAAGFMSINNFTPCGKSII